MVLSRSSASCSMAAPLPARSPPGGHAHATRPRAAPVALARRRPVLPEPAGGRRSPRKWHRPCGQGALARLEPRRVRGADGRVERVRRVRRDRQPGGAPVDLSGLEVVYSTSTGSTVTRKATWSGSTVLAPGRRTLLVNGAGSCRCGRHDLYGSRGDRRVTALRIVGGRRRRRGRLGRRDERVRGGTLVMRLQGRSRASSGGPVALQATGLTSMTTRRTGSSPPLRRRRTSRRRLYPARTRRRRPRPRRLSPHRPLARSRRRRRARRRLLDPKPDRRADPKPDRRADPHAGTDRDAHARADTQCRRQPPIRTATPTPSPSIVAIADARAMPDASTVTIAGVLTTDLGAVESARAGSSRITGGTAAST